MKKPNLIIIGAPKTGTTSLHYYLSQHPEIYMSEDKEPHYFCKDLHKENDEFFGYDKYFRHRSQESYSSIFQNATNEKIIGEASTTYIYSKVAAKQIHDFDPDMKIIAIIRDPLDLAFSWYNYLKFLTHETADTFEEALKLEKSRKSNQKLIPNCVLYPTSIFYSEIVDFDQNLKRFTDLFSRENCKFILFDDLKKDVGSIYKEVLDFLEVDTEFVADFEMQNVSRSARFGGMKQKVDNATFAIRQKFYQYRNTTILRKAKETYNTIFVKEGVKAIMQEEEKQQMRKWFYEKVELTGKFLDKDLLTKWKYK